MEQELKLFVDAAEQLEELKNALLKQKNESDRLRDLNAILARISDQIARVPEALAPLLSKAEASENRLNFAAEKIESLRDSIPTIIERIERSDIGRSIDSLTSDIEGTRNDLRGFRDAAASLQSIVVEYRSSQHDAAQLLAAEVERIRAAQGTVSATIASLQLELISRLENLLNVSSKTAAATDSAAGASANSFALTIGAIRAAADRHSAALQQLTDALTKRGEDVSALRQELQAINERIATQSRSLDALSRKKGFTF